MFTAAFVLQKPTLERAVALGMMSMPSASPRVGQPLTLQWRLERLATGWLGKPAEAEREEEGPLQVRFFSVAHRTVNVTL